MLKRGDKVRMSEKLKDAFRSNGSAEHVKEFGECIGFVEDEVDWGKGFVGPEVNVRWQPSKLRYMYDPNALVKVDANSIKEK